MSVQVVKIRESKHTIEHKDLNAAVGSDSFSREHARFIPQSPIDECTLELKCTSHFANSVRRAMYEGPGVALRLTSIDTNDPYLLVHDSQVVTIVEQTPVSQDATVGQQFSINVTNTGTIPWIVRAGLFESASKRALPFDDQMWIATLLPGSYLRLDAIVTMGLGDDPSTAAYKVAHVAYDELESDAQYRITVSGRRLRARATMTRSMRWLREMFARYTFEEFERVRVVVDDGFSQFNIEEKYTVGSTLERYAYDLDNTVGLVVYKIPNQLERKGVMNVKHADPSRLLAAAAAQIVGDCDIVIGNLED